MQHLNLYTFLSKKNNHRPVVFNVVLWLLAFVIFIFIFSKGQKPITADYIYTIGFLLVLAIPANINFYGLIPKFLKKEKYVIYTILLILISVAFSTILIVCFETVLNYLFSEYFFISYLKSTEVYLIFGIVLIVTTLLKLAEDWFYFNSNENRLLKIENQNIQTQLTTLRGQINPHFLFNSLNVIYAMALEKKEDITSAILELSDVLRYVIYDADTNHVSLKDELKLIENYIAFQKYRGHSKDDIQLKTDIDNYSFQIYPMLLLPLLENAYKYGFVNQKASDYIRVNIKQKDAIFQFNIKNSKSQNAAKTDEDYSGVGLRTLKNNLQLVYPNKHTFHIDETEHYFSVKLTITNE